MTTQARGSGTVVALFEETTYATDPGTPSGTKLYYTNFGLAKTQNRIDSAVLGGSRSRVEPYLGNASISGAMATEIAAESIGTLLKHTLGVDTPTGAGPYVHTLTIGESLPIGLTLEMDYGSAIAGSGRYIKYNGCRVNSAEFNFPVEGACTANFNFIGAKAVAASSPLDATLTDNGHTTFSSFSAAIEEGGASIAIVKSAQIMLDNAIETDGYVIGGGGQLALAPEGFATISGQIETLFSSAALMNKALADTESSLKITLSRGTGLGSAGNESIEFLVQQLKYSPVTPPVEGPGGIKIALAFKGYRKTTTNGLQITLKNALATI